MNLVLLKFVCIMVVVSKHCNALQPLQRNLGTRSMQTGVASTRSAKANIQAVEKSDEFAYLEKDIPDLNLFKSYGYWTLRASSTKTKITHVIASFKDNKVVADVYEDEEQIGSRVLTHIENSNIISGTGPWRGPISTTKYIILNRDENVIIKVVVNQTERHLAIFSRSDANVPEEAIKGMLKQVLLKPNIKRLLRNLLPTLEYKNTETDFLQDLNPLNNDDIQPVDYSLNVGNWTVKASTEKPLSFKNGRLAIQDGRIIFYALNGNDLFGIGSGGLIKNSHGIAYDFFIKPLDRVIIGKAYSLYVDKTIIIKVIIFQNEPHKSLRVFSRTGAPFDRQHIKQLIEKQLLFNKNINRLIGDIVPDLVFYD